MSRQALSQAFSIGELREQAKRRLPRAVFDFFDGGAEDEQTLRENRAAFDRARNVAEIGPGLVST